MTRYVEKSAELDVKMSEMLAAGENQISKVAELKRW